MLTVVTADMGDYVLGSWQGENFVPWRELEGYQWLMRLEAESEWRMVIDS